MATLTLVRKPSPTDQDVALARASRQRLSRYKGAVSIQVLDAESETPLELPAGAVVLLLNILDAMAAGRGVSIIPENAELTTVEAATLLNVSRPYLIKLLAQKAIPYRTVGKHRRLLMEDVMAYKEKTDAAREAVLDELVIDAQEQGMGYELA